MKIVCLLACVALVVGCSARGGYEGIRTSVRNECARLPPSQNERCLERAKQPYEAYLLEREALRNAEQAHR